MGTRRRRRRGSLGIAIHDHIKLFLFTKKFSSSSSLYTPFLKLSSQQCSVGLFSSDQALSRSGFLRSPAKRMCRYVYVGLVLSVTAFTYYLYLCRVVLFCLTLSFSDASGDGLLGRFFYVRSVSSGTPPFNRLGSAQSRICLLMVHSSRSIYWSTTIQGHPATDKTAVELQNVGELRLAGDETIFLNRNKFEYKPLEMNGCDAILLSSPSNKCCTPIQFANTHGPMSSSSSVVVVVWERQFYSFGKTQNSSHFVGTSRENNWRTDKYPLTPTPTNNSSSRWTDHRHMNTAFRLWQILTTTYITIWLDGIHLFKERNVHISKSLLVMTGSASQPPHPSSQQQWWANDLWHGCFVQ